MWTKIFAGVDVDFTSEALIQTNDDGYAIAGYTTSFGAGYYDVWLIKTDVNGDTLWTKTYGGEENDVARRFLQTNDGGYAIIGYTNSFGAGSSDIWLLETDSNGKILKRNKI